MRNLLFITLSLGSMALPGTLRASPPPSQGELKRQLRRQPVDLAHWAEWSPRLRDWSGQHFKAAFPAFSAGMNLVMRQHRIQGDRLTLPKPLDEDAVAWMLLASAFLRDSKPRLGQEAARYSIERDKTLAAAHYYLSWGLWLEQLTPRSKGGPEKPDGGRLQESLRHLREARVLDPSIPWASDAQAGEIAVRAEKWDEAESFLREAHKQKPDDIKVARLLARSITRQEFPWYDRRRPFTPDIKPLADQFSGDGELASYHALALLRDNRHSDAAVQMARARELGYDPARVLGPKTVQGLETQQSQDSLFSAPLSFFAWVGRWSLRFTLFYASVMGLMCLAGLLLARRTRGPRAADMLGQAGEDLAAGGKVTRTRHESWLTRFYAVALLLGLVLFYLSLPFVFVGLLIVFLMLLVLALGLRRDPDIADTHGALMRASGGGMKAVFKAMFARVGTGSFGLRKGRRDCPKLYAALDEVARRVETDPVDEVWIAPGADFGVHQEGRGPFGVFGGRKRVLTLGLCVMHYLSISEFKSILAHEYAHFSHADTYWNRFLFQVTLSLRTAMREMARTGGWVTYVNPFFWFFWLYSRSYSLLSSGFSRSREFLADRMACTLYGAEVFARALRKVCTDGSHFEGTVYHNIVRLLKHKKAYVNMYLAFRQHRDENLSEEDRRKLHRKLLDERPSLFASHPTFQERMEAARQLPRAQTIEDASSLELFEDPQKIEQELTDFLTEVVARYLRI
jgi:Zn-dependent protease with chaperone function